MAAGLVDQLSALGWNVEFNPKAVQEVRDIAMCDEEADADIGKIHKPRAVSSVNERVAEDVGRIIQRGALPLTLGGDHSLVSKIAGSTAITAICRGSVANDLSLNAATDLRPWERSPEPSRNTPTQLSFGYVCNATIITPNKDAADDRSTPTLISTRL